MYKIERFLLDHKFRKKKDYGPGVTVYSDYRTDSEYTAEVAVFVEKSWEIAVYSSHAVVLRNGGFGSSERDKESYTGRMRVFADCQVDYAFRLKQWLDAIEDPWGFAE